MNCPTDGTRLEMTERSGIEIDYCPTCRGVWLDRGELDKIIDRAANALTAPPAYAAPDRERDREPDRGRYDDDRSDKDRRKRKKRSFLDDLFDFD